MKSTTRSRRLRNVHLHDEKQKESFFSKSSNNDKRPFFNAQQSGGQQVVQTKLTIGKPGDQYEQEADRVANHVVAKSGQSPEVQRQDPDSVQRVTLMSPAEDEKLGTAEARMEKDKLIQEKIQKMDDREEPVQAQQEEEEPVQAQKEEEEPVQAQQEEEEPVQAQQEEEEPVQAQQEEEEPVQAQQEEEEPVQAQQEEEEPVQAQQEEEEVQAKRAEGGTANPAVSEKIKKSSGKGRPLSGVIRDEMEQAFGADFSGVNIHTDAEAIRLNKQLHSQAFTRGNDIFFNEGKYRPETNVGKLLLAHELTHVIQQCGRKLASNDKKQK